MNLWMMMLNSAALALFWSSLSNNAAQVRFSRSAAITTHDDKAFLLIQAVPQWMPRPIVFAKVQVFVEIVRKDPGTGEVLSCRQEQLPLKQSTFCIRPRRDHPPRNRREQPLVPVDFRGAKSGIENHNR